MKPSKTRGLRADGMELMSRFARSQRPQLRMAEGGEQWSGALTDPLAHAQAAMQVPAGPGMDAAGFAARNPQLGQGANPNPNAVINTGQDASTSSWLRDKNAQNAATAASSIMVRGWGGSSPNRQALQGVDPTTAPVRPNPAQAAAASSYQGDRVLPPAPPRGWGGRTTAAPGYRNYGPGGVDAFNSGLPPPVAGTLRTDLMDAGSTNHPIFQYGHGQYGDTAAAPTWTPDKGAPSAQNMAAANKMVSPLRMADGGGMPSYGSGNIAARWMSQAKAAMGMTPPMPPAPAPITPTPYAPAAAAVPNPVMTGPATVPAPTGIGGDSLRARIIERQGAAMGMRTGGEAWHGHAVCNDPGMHGTAPGFSDGTGGRVPGKGEGDKIPAMYEPGEFVVSNEMMAASPGLREELRDLRGHVLAAKGMTPEQADAKAMNGGRMHAEFGADTPLPPIENVEPLIETPAQAAARLAQEGAASGEFTTEGAPRAPQPNLSSVEPTLRNTGGKVPEFGQTSRTAKVYAPAPQVGAPLPPGAGAEPGGSGVTGKLNSMADRVNSNTTRLNQGFEKATAKVNAINEAVKDTGRAAGRLGGAVLNNPLVRGAGIVGSGYSAMRDAGDTLRHADEGDGALAVDSALHGGASLASMGALATPAGAAGAAYLAGHAIGTHVINPRLSDSTKESIGHGVNSLLRMFGGGVNDDALMKLNGTPNQPPAPPAPPRSGGPGDGKGGALAAAVAAQQQQPNYGDTAETLEGRRQERDNQTLRDTDLGNRMEADRLRGEGRGLTILPNTGGYGLFDKGYQDRRNATFGESSIGRLNGRAKIADDMNRTHIAVSDADRAARSENLRDTLNNSLREHQMDNANRITTTGMTTNAAMAGHKMTNAYNLANMQREQFNADRTHAAGRADASDTQTRANQKQWDEHTLATFVMPSPDGKGTVPDTQQAAQFTQFASNLLKDPAMAKAYPRGIADLVKDTKDMAALHTLWERKKVQDATHSPWYNPFGSSGNSSMNPNDYVFKKDPGGNSLQTTLRNGAGEVPVDALQYGPSYNRIIPNWGSQRSTALMPDERGR